MAIGHSAGVCGAPVITQLLGGAPDEQPERYREASPIEMLPLGVRQVFFAGRMLAAQAPTYAESAHDAGDSVRAVILSEAGHFVFVDPDSAAWRDVLEATRAIVGMAR